MLKFGHMNFNVFDLEKSLAFYKEALGLETVKERKAGDGSFILNYVGLPGQEFSLELTWLRDRETPYDLGDQEFHLAFVTDDYDAMHQKHAEMGVICYENPGMGIYFIQDPDQYWIEIVPKR